MSVISLAVRSCLPVSLNHTLTIQLMVIASWPGAFMKSSSASYVLFVLFQDVFLVAELVNAKRIDKESTEFYTKTEK